MDREGRTREGADGEEENQGRTHHRAREESVTGKVSTGVAWVGGE